MPRTLILYRSPHHGNTKKLLDAIAAKYPDVELVRAGEDTFDPAQYDIVCIASGVYGGKLHRAVRKALDEIDGNGRRAFAVYTCGDKAGVKYGERMMQTLRLRGFLPEGFYWCVGLDTFGPLRFVGGVNKGRPNAEDIEDAIRFFAQKIMRTVK